MGVDMMAVVSNGNGVGLLWGKGGYCFYRRGGREGLRVTFRDWDY